MTLPMSPAYWLLALVPILFLMTAIMKCGWSVARSAPFGMGLALVIALVFYRARPLAMADEAIKGIWNAATILLVVWPAVFSYEVTRQARGFEAIRSGIQSLTRHELMQILILGWIFPSFLQGITGFGVAVAVGAPLLLSIGVSPLYSIVIVLLCHSWGGTFGTLALAWNALVEQSGLTGPAVASAATIAAAMIWAYNVVAVLFSIWLYGKGRALREAALPVVILSLITGGGELLLAPVNATVAMFLPSAAALGAVFLICRLPRYQREWSVAASPIMDRRGSPAGDLPAMTFHQAFLSYYVLAALTITGLLVRPVNRLLSRWQIGLSFPAAVTGYGYATAAEPLYSPIRPLTYAGTFLAVSALISCLYFHRHQFIDGAGIREAWQRTIAKCLPTTTAITCFIIMSRFMSSSGQIYILSQGIVTVLGRRYIVAAPFFGMLGSFMTSSNMSSNILLSRFQMTAAEILQVSPAVTLALQTVGGVLGNAFSPSCVMMGISTIGLQGADGQILRKMVPIACLCALAFGLFAYFALI